MKEKNLLRVLSIAQNLSHIYGQRYVQNMILDARNEFNRLHEGECLDEELYSVLSNKAILRRILHENNRIAKIIKDPIGDLCSDETHKMSESRLGYNICPILSVNHSSINCLYANKILNLKGGLVYECSKWD